MSYGDSSALDIGVCQVFFGTAGSEAELGYTEGGVTVKYTADTKEIEVDQEAAPVAHKITKQSMEVTVPLAERNLERFQKLFPGSTYTLDTGGEKEKLVMSGAPDIDYDSKAGSLILKPDAEDANTWLTLHKALPQPTWTVKYDKDNLRIYEITFKAMVEDTKGLATWGDETATAA